jgi:hypothetical protein
MTGVEMVSHSTLDAAPDGSQQSRRSLTVNIASGAMELNPHSLGPLAAVIAAATSGRPATPPGKRYPASLLPAGEPDVVRVMT